MRATERKLLTAEDLLELHSRGVRGELIRGIFCETVPTGIEHGEIAGNFITGLSAHVKPRKLGRVFGSNSGICLERDPDTVREPDVGYISAEKLPLGARITGYSEVAPDLVVEIVSPSETGHEIYDKACMWLRHGVRLVWVADPESRTVDVHRQDGATIRLHEDDVLDGAPVLPGFTLPVREAFT